MTSITVKINDKLIFIKLDNVTYFEADNNYTTIHSQFGSFLITESISRLEKNYR
ncbi:DNA-binding LytR/AlgR family response regulator [Flavobacterium sp. PL11]|jgi:two-component system LytT family response regulator|nr:DNA-binding LytR/AlgR family response regulator [Flavobacterium sp. PL11]